MSSLRSTIWLISVFSAALIVSRPVAGTVLAGPIANPANGHDYYLLAPATWNAAEAEAQTLGGHLATINNAAENIWISTNIAARASAPSHLWIGLEDFDAPDPKTANSFHWISGDPSPYRNWRPDNPEFLDTEFCTLVVGPGASPAELPGTWVNLICANVFNGVVEVGSTPTETPTATSTETPTSTPIPTGTPTPTPTEIPPQVDLSVSALDIAQATFSTQLVLGRETALLIKVYIAGTLPSQPVSIEARLAGNVVAAAATNLAGTNTTIDFPVQLFIPDSPGDHDLLVTIDSFGTITESDESNNVSMQRLHVRQTKQLVVPYVLVASCSIGTCYSGSLAEAPTHMTESNEFMRATYPLTQSALADDLLTSPITGSIVPCVGPLCVGLLRDSKNVFKAAKRSNGNTKRAVGIVPDDYFNYHGLCCADSQGIKHCVLGARVGGELGVLTTVGHWTAAAHEIGHTFGFGEGYTTDPSLPCGEQVTKAGEMTNGYYATRRQPIRDVIDFMGTSPGYQLSLFPQPARWVSIAHWDSLIQQLDVQADDPRVLLVSGIFYADGTLELDSWYSLEGVPDTPKPGPFAIRLSDMKGTQLFVVPFDMPFTMHLDPYGEMPSEVSGFTFSIPYPTNAALLTIEGPDGKVLAQIDPTAKLLSDAVMALPSDCFRNNPVQRRQALLNKVEAVERMIAKNGIRNSVEKMTNDIRLRADTWIRDGCEAPDALQTSKQEIMAIIDDLIVRMLDANND